MPVSVAYQFMHSNTAPLGMSRGIGDGKVEENNNGVDFLKILNQIDDHFFKASENAQEVSKMLDANRMHYHSSEFCFSFLLLKIIFCSVSLFNFAIDSSAFVIFS
ncbi:hypothetical protein Adt_04088 [Abeliophyllum distichum]|uniref:DUF632 domain-containing protein n=1 Tax=Abeliophyllum distichum TaxID=126358 RepID=A0ABD1W3Q5_9LAMI